MFLREPYAHRSGLRSYRLIFGFSAAYRRYYLDLGAEVALPALKCGGKKGHIRRLPLRAGERYRCSGCGMVFKRSKHNPLV